MSSTGFSPVVAVVLFTLACEAVQRHVKHSNLPEASWSMLGDGPNNVADNEGKLVGTVPGYDQGGSDSSCEAACRAHPQCFSAALCNDKCYLRDRQFKGDEPHHAHGKCTTHFFKAPVLLEATSASQNGTVCVSVNVYEEVAWVNRLLANFFAFAEPSTRIVMHLNAASEYSETQIQEWEKYENNRVAVTTKNRVKVQPFFGSILWAHLHNVETMDETWDQNSKLGECSFFLMQASNMLWVRKGFEAEVRSRRYGQITDATADEGGCSRRLPISEELIKPRHLYAKGQPEGSFYPMSMMRKFLKLQNTWILPMNDDVNITATAIGNVLSSTSCYLEAYSLQTYALNFEEEVIRNQKFYQNSLPLTWNHITYGHKEDDSVPLEEVKLVHEADPKWKQYYAVKRVNRNLDHPTTVFILGLKP